MVKFSTHSNQPNGIVAVAVVLKIPANIEGEAIPHHLAFASIRFQAPV